VSVGKTAGLLLTISSRARRALSARGAEELAILPGINRMALRVCRPIRGTDDAFALITETTANEQLSGGDYDHDTCIPRGRRDCGVPGRWRVRAPPARLPAGDSWHRCGGGDSSGRYPPQNRENLPCRADARNANHPRPETRRSDALPGAAGIGASRGGRAVHRVVRDRLERPMHRARDFTGRCGLMSGRLSLDTPEAIGKLTIFAASSRHPPCF
jgi:hypothetical protein